MNKYYSCTGVGKVFQRPIQHVGPAQENEPEARQGENLA